MSTPQIHFGMKPLFYLFFSLLFVTSCEEQPVQEVLIRPNAFVNTFTSGQISAQSPVSVIFNLPEEFAKVSQQDPVEGIFWLKPDVEGKTYWADQFTLVFKPDKSLQNGRKYQAEVNLKKLLGIEDPKNQVFRFSFDVIPLSFSVEMEALQPYRPDNMQWNFLKGRIRSSDAVTVANVEKLLEVKQLNKTLKLRFLEETGDNIYSFIIDSVERMDDPSQLIFTWQGDQDVFGFEQKKMTYMVSSLAHFTFVRAVVNNDPDQSVRLEFSDPIDRDQDLDGLIYFTDDTPFRLTLENNTILINPTEHLTGEKTITIKNQLRTQKDIHLKKDILQTVQFGQIKPAVRFPVSGTIMPGEDGWTLPFEAVNLQAVDVFIRKIYTNNIRQFLQVNRLSGKSQLDRVGELVHHEKVILRNETEGEAWRWKSYALDLSKMIEEEAGAIYRVELRYRKSYATYNCGDESSRDDELTGRQLERYENNSYYYPSAYNWYERDDPCAISYYNSGRFVQKNVMASNIGLTVKEDGDALLVYANDLKTTLPMEDVKITLTKYQQQEITTAITDRNGIAKLDFTARPYLLLAEYEGQFAYQRLDGGSALSYSKFNTRGVNIEKGIKGFIYGERGVWRPGDTLFLTVIVDDHENPLPKGHPVILKLTDPRGKERAKKTAIKGTNGFYSFRIPTNAEDQTGFWKATAEVGGAVFNKTIRIETIKPNRLKIELSFDDTLLSPENNKGTMKVRWLHGGIASRLKADVNITIRPGKTTFKGFEDYNFDDPAPVYPPEQLTIFDGRLNEKGIAVFDFDLPDSRFAPGKLKVSIASKVFEQGGDFSIDQSTADFAPFDNFIGIKGPETQAGAYGLEVDNDQVFEIATVSKTGKAVSLDKLEYEVYKLDWSWWYASNRRNRNLASYISRHYDRKVKSGEFRTKNGTGKFSIKLNYPDWGWYYIRIKQADGGHQTGMKVYFDWPSWYSRENRKAPGSMSLLSLTTDKEKYNTGESVKVSVPTPANGRLLITLEKGNKQLRSWQMDAEAKETVISFKATPEMTPNVYLYVSVLQPHAQTVNDLPIRMYGLVPVMIEDRQTVLEPVLQLPESVRPNGTYTISVSERNNKKMTYTLAVVDEGLLDLTHFKTPSPHKHFYAKEALAVKTWDIYDDVMGAFGKRLEKVFAIGGDMEMEAEMDEKKANRFKPVVTFLGPFELREGATNSHELQMPNYIGSVRCMVIAGEDGAYGHVQKTFPVKQPLMVLGTLPRVLSPGETVKLPLSVFVLDEKIKKVSVRVETNSFFELNKSSQILEILQEGEHMVYFELKVVDKQGVGKVRIIVSSGAETASYEMELLVRNPNPRAFETTYHLLKAGEKLEHIPKLIGTGGSNEINLAVSGLPPMNLEQRTKYLIRYPYGCIEQTTSSVFPQLFLDKLLELDMETRQRIEKNIRSGIKRLNGFQLSDGGFSYWSGSRRVSDWGTTYAGHFLLMAKERGYYVSQTVLNSWVEYQRKSANKWVFQKYGALNQAYRLYTLALAGRPNLGAMNRLREIDDLPPSARFRLATAYALTGQNTVAKKLIRGVKYVATDDNRYWYSNYGSDLRDQAMILETFVVMGETDKGIPFFKHIAEELKGRRWMSTQTTAYALYAVTLFVNEDEGQGKGFSFNYVWNEKASAKLTSLAPVFSTDLEVKKENKLQVENLSEKALFVTLTSSGIPVMEEEVRFAKNLELEIRYYDLDGKLLDVRNLKHGTDFYAEATVRNPGSYGRIKNMALTQIFPSGWEIINTRMLDLGAELKSDQSDFIDYHDDRVNIFFSLRARQKKRFVVLLNAAYQGKYYLPVSRCADMYNNEVNAVSGGGWVNVTK